MEAPLLVPAAETRVETQAGNSRFITTIGTALTVNEAKAFIQRVKAEFSDATHHVPAYIIGHGRSTLAHCHDDGEPAGTAGRPMLAVLQGSGLGDVVAVVTRYFGGTKLGTGGLVRAYGDAVRAALVALPRAEKVATTTVMVEFPYSLLERVRQLVESHDGIIIDEQFAAAITLTARFRSERFPEFAVALRELSHGSVEAVVVETNEATIMPL
ncbi:MAG: YigZ family protein [Anaerolineae bacterium]|nr:YigZ family protein [Anaerolineales bacterium]MCB8934215.1 YigZ family protein [Promineifilum sp.]MCW5845604.1 YigZ family protein [Anaerolineae bacterium]